MKRISGHCLADLIALIAVVLFAIAVLLPTLDKPGAKHAASGANLRNIYLGSAMYGYQNDDQYPVAGVTDWGKPMVGFHGELNGSTDVTPQHPAMVNNVTASLWMLAQDGSVNTRSFINPSTGNVRQVVEGSLNATWDFAGHQHLSYSMSSMYHAASRRWWHAEPLGSIVLLGDDNNNDHAERHTLAVSDGATTKQVRERENSSNYGGVGQQLAYADGSVRFTRDPFRGPSDDNVYAMIVDGRNAPPTLGLNDGDAATDQTLLDNVLVPLTGNGGASLSGQPPSVARGYEPSAVVWLHDLGWLLGVIAIWVAVRGVAYALRKRKSVEPTNA